MRTAIFAAATALAAMAAPVLAQEYDASRGFPEFDLSRPGTVAPPVYTFGALPSPNTSAPLFYSGSTPYGMFTGTTQQLGNMRMYNTIGPNGSMTTCVQTFSGGQPFVNCF